MEDKIREAYDQMTPTPEQEERMLAALQEAQLKLEAANAEAQPADPDGSKAASSEAQPTGHGENSGVSFEAKPVPAQKRSGFSAWKVVAPIAACLVVGAIAVGTGVLGQGGGNTAPIAPSAASVSSATSNNSTATESAKAQRDAGQTSEKQLLLREEEAADSAYESGAMGMAATSTDVEVVPSDPYNTEEYAAVDENGFVSTKTQPLSTVSADVDTASYANLRRMINSGYTLDRVPAGAVRIEEMLNYFTYDYKKPTGSDLFSMQAQVSQCPWNPDTQLLTIGFATPSEASVAEKGANLVFLIDVSGSMNSQDKLDLLQDSFATLLENLDERDRVSIVTYSGAEEIVLEGVPGNDDGQILRAIYKLNASGSTNGEAGLKMAYEVAERNFIEGGVNRIVMASDGDLNVGVTSESDLYDLVDKKRESGVYLSVLGFGTGNYKDTKMEVLADHGNGSYHYIDSTEEANRVLSERLMANLVPFADDVKAQVEFNPAQVKGYRLIGYENRELAAEDFRDDTVDAGDVGPNAQFTVAYEIVPVDSAYEVKAPELKYGQSGSREGSASGYANNSADWLTCSLRYHAFSDNAVHEQQLVVSGKDTTANPTDDWKFAASVIEFGMLASNSDYRGDLTCDSVLDLLNSQHLNDERKSFKDLVEKAKRAGEGTAHDKRWIEEE